VRSVSRFLLAGLLLFALGIRGAELHRHDDSAPHTESCSLCRVAQTPFAAPLTAVVFHRAVEIEAPLELCEPEVPAPDSIVLESLRLRAPPCS
jgi:hypothetical protein